ncbi:pyocin knob domain-containing protein [Lactobacillus amylovorus]|uniref:pyocin knob domain-containing protein n=1 Tax=Lactobacillus amylovorus TaxID=1604 RepID=UPI00232E9C9B|nr:pyocin knob domain-containing protein [Lactobacillus amylovorus]MDB6263637.1 pyocin knob domain-containing protein [Lactobacillus amylovorus]
MVEDSKFNNTILTNIGHQMLTSISSGNKKITYTKAEAYTQDVSSISNETLQALTSLQGKELSANLLVSNDNGNVITITANFRNKGLTNDVVFNSIGWFAKLDTDDVERGITANQEYLIGITPANGAQTLVAPPADQSSSQAISINLNMTLSDASNVNMTVSDAGAVHFNQLDDQLAKYTTTADLTKLLAGKADLGLSYTKAEIDAKLLNLTTDTDGKVSADQVQALISDKANISDVYTKSQVDNALSTRDTEISTKANISDVYTKSQVDSALSTRDTEISTKANISDVYTKSDVDNAFTDVRGRLGKLEGAQTLDSPDFNSITSTGVYYITNNTPANIKNNPASQWGVLVVSNGNGNRTSQVYYPDDGSPQWCRLLNGNNWLPWYQLSTKKDISNAINKFDLSKVKFRKQYLNSDGDKADKTWSATKNDDGTYTIDLYNDDWTAAKLADVIAQLPNKANTSDVYTKNQIGDAFRNRDNSITSLINRVKQIDGETVIENAVDVNTLEGTPNQVTVYKLSNAGNTNTPSWIGDHRGVMIVLNYDGNAKTQIWTPVGSGAFNEDGSFGWRYWEGNTPPNWSRLASVSYVDNLHNNLQNQINAKLNKTDTVNVVNSYDVNNNQNGGLNKWPVTQAWYVDQTALRPFADQINQLKGRRQVDTPDFNNLTDTGTYYVSNPGANAPTGSWGNLLVSNGAGHRTSQMYFPDDGSALYMRELDETTWRGWIQLATTAQVNDLQNQIQQLRDNQFEVQTFTDATAAANWEAQKPGKRMAIVNS